MEPQRDEDGNRRAIAAFLIALAALVLFDPALRWLARPPAALGADAPAGAFSSARARAFHQRVFDAHAPHPVGSAEHERARDRLVAELEGLGLAPVVEEHTVLRGNVLARVRNVVVPDVMKTGARSAPPERAGANGRDAVLLCAHYDSVAAGPGAGDDGAGVAVLLEVARALRAEPRTLEHPVRILFDDGEEMGLLGAQAFVEESAFRADVGVVVNLEARGTRGASRMFETSTGNAALVEACGALPHPSATSVSVEVYRRMPNDTDLTVFKAAGLPGINFAFVGGGRRYHTRLDDREHLDPDTLQHHGENALAAVRALAARTGAFAKPGRDGDAVYADLAGSVLLRWPAWAAPWIALAVLLAFALVARAAVKRGETRVGELLRGAAVALGALAIAVALAAALDTLVTSARSGVYPWPPDSALARAGIGLAGGAGAAWAAAIVLPGRSGGARGLVLGLALLHALLGLAVAVFVPGASYLFALPLVLAGGLAAGLAAALAARRPGLVVAVLVAAGACVWLPFLAGLEEVFELRTRALPACLALAAVWAWLAAPLVVALARAGRRARVAAALAPTALALALVLAARATPERLANEPEPVSLAHVERAGDAEARVGVREFGARDLSAWLDARGFAAEATNPFPWWPRGARMRSASAPRAGFAAPRAEVLSDWDGASEQYGFADSERRVELELASQRAARLCVLELPRGVTLRAVRDARGARKALALRGSFTAIGFGSEPLQLLLGVEGTEPVEADVLDVHSADGGRLGELVRELPSGFEPIGEGAVTVSARRVRL